MFHKIARTASLMHVNYFLCVALSVKVIKVAGWCVRAAEQRAGAELLPSCPDAVRVTARGFCHVEE